VLWPEDRVVDRGWLLENIRGAVGLLVFLTDKVRNVDAHDAHRTNDLLD